jgi:hypothetical protein
MLQRVGEGIIRSRSSVFRDMGAMLLRIIALSLVAVIAPLAAHAAVIPPCPPPAGVVSTTLSDVHAPPALMKALRGQLGPMAGPGQPFNATDVVTPGDVGRRFILLWGLGSRWVIAYEQGGIAYYNEAVAFQVSGTVVTKLADKQAEPPTLCAAVHALIGR